MAFAPARVARMFGVRRLGAAARADPLRQRSALLGSARSGDRMSGPQDLGILRCEPREPACAPSLAGLAARPVPVAAVLAH
jgi:hypothetical protein